jgi:hypothetical protein
MLLNPELCLATLTLPRNTEGASTDLMRIHAMNLLEYDGVAYFDLDVR